MFSARLVTKSFSCISLFLQCARIFLQWMSCSKTFSADLKASASSHMLANVWFLPCNCRLRWFRWDMIGGSYTKTVFFKSQQGDGMSNSEILGLFGPSGWIKWYRLIALATHPLKHTEHHYAANNLVTRRVYGFCFLQIGEKTRKTVQLPLFLLPWSRKRAPAWLLLHTPSFWFSYLDLKFRQPYQSHTSIQLLSLSKSPSNMQRLSCCAVLCRCWRTRSGCICICDF